MMTLSRHARPPRRTSLIAAALCVLALSCAPTSRAAPAAHDDAVSRFLAERGLSEAALEAPPAGGERGLVQQVRDTASDMVLTAMGFLGVPYRRGGNSAEEGFDCSGFTRHIFEKSLGLVLPRRADDQAAASGFVPVQREELKPGDLVFFNTLRRTFSHVGIYIGEGKFIHSPRTGAKVRVEDMRQTYWTKRYTGARRADMMAGGTMTGERLSSPQGQRASNAAPEPKAR